MEIKITTKQILKVLYVLAWIVFIGLCVEAGGIVFNAVYAVGYKPIAAINFWKGINLSPLLEYDKGYFITIIILMSIVAILKAILFYSIVSILHNKKLSFTQPFNEDIKRFIFTLSYLAIGIGFFAYWGTKQIQWLSTKGIALPDVQSLGFGGADVWIFMGIILFVIAQVFKRGIEIQSENDLTI
ncbi:MAG: DUF2975 domain-containing protein [Ferruginibacter sp.]